MKTEELVFQMRQTLVDWGPYGPTVNTWKTDDADMLWKNTELAFFLKRAEEEYCRRFPITDTTTTAVCQATVTAADPVVAVDPRVRELRRVKLSTGTKPLEPIWRSELDELLPDTWEAETGEPTHFIPDWERLKIRLYPIPTVTGTAAFEVGRNPINDITWKNIHREPEIPEMDHVLLLDWALHLAYLKDDTEETFDMKRAGTFRDIFNSNVGGDISVVASEARRKLAARPIRTRTYYK